MRCRSSSPDRNGVLRALGRRLATRKVAVARRVARAANPGIVFDAIAADIADPAAARTLIDCDYVFWPPTGLRARLVFNALVQQYLIPGVEVGAKSKLDKHGRVTDVFSAVRHVLPGFGCLWCKRAHRSGPAHRGGHHAAQLARPALHR